MGIDEAGAGEVVGSFYIGYVETDEPEAVEALDLRDSKLLNRNTLEEKYSEISGVAETGVVAISPTEIEEMGEDGVTLQEMEDYAIASLLGHTPPDVLQLDCYYPTSGILETRLRDLMPSQAEHVDLRVQHRAEERWSLVAAAGIVAKIHQLREYSRLRRLHGDVFGSGNGSDSRTRDFLRERGEDRYFVRNGNLSGN